MGRGLAMGGGFGAEGIVAGGAAAAQLSEVSGRGAISRVVLGLPGVRARGADDVLSAAALHDPEVSGEGSGGGRGGRDAGGGGVFRVFVLSSGEVFHAAWGGR